MSRRGTLVGLSRPERLAVEHPAFVPNEVKRFMLREQAPKRRRRLWVRLLIAVLIFLFAWAFVEIKAAANQLRDDLKAAQPHGGHL